MDNRSQDDVHMQLLETLMSKVEADTYPSTTMLDVIESLLRPDDVDDYAELLLEKIRSETYPSLDLVRRLTGLQ